jgi:hypothetical protein
LAGKPAGKPEIVASESLACRKACLPTAFLRIGLRANRRLAPESLVNKQFFAVYLPELRVGIA